MRYVLPARHALGHGDAVEALAQQLEEHPDTYQATNRAAVVCPAPHTEQENYTIPMWVIRTCGKFKARHSHAVWKPMAELCLNAAFQDRGFLLSADANGDTRRSREMEAALHA